jgi:hypothetical protein
MTIRVTDESHLTVSKSVPWTVEGPTVCSAKYCDV